jgi:hypothetical protein
VITTLEGFRNHDVTKYARHEVESSGNTAHLDKNSLISALKQEV